MIPNQAHCIWYGQSFAWPYALALISAARNGGFDRVLLHHADQLLPGAPLAAIREEAGIELHRLEPQTLFARTRTAPDRLQTLYNRLTAPAAKANMIRAAILATAGGVYLDTDTITLKSFRPLLASGCFCGTEHIVLPGSIYATRNPLLWLGAGCKLAARDLCRRLPRGYRWFQYIKGYYRQAVNNAVLGASAGHPLILQMLEEMVTMEPRKQLQRYGLGTHLLQRVTACYGGDDLRIYPPSFFYPLSPEISEHWFRRNPSRLLPEVVTDETLCIHWYNSVRTTHLIPRIDPPYIHRHRHHQFYSALVYNGVKSAFDF